MKLRFLLFNLLTLISIVVLKAQCPGCVIDETVHPSTGNEDLGIFPSAITVQAGQDTTITFQFLMPLNLTVSGISATVQTVQILDVVDLPSNTTLDWVCDQSATNCEYFPQTYRYGCVTVCMNTLALPGTYTISVDVYGTGQAAGITQGQSLPIPVEVTVLPAEGNPFFTMSTNVGCGDVSLGLEQTLPPQLVINPVTYDWVVDGDTMSGPMANYSVSGAGEHEVELIETIDEFYISAASLTVTGTCYCGDADEVDWPLIGCTQAPDPYLIINAGNGSVTTSVQGDNSTPTWTGLDIPISDLAISIQAWDEDVILNPHDDMGSFLTSIIIEPTVGSQNFSTGCTSGTYTISRRQKIVNNYFDTLTIYESSVIPLVSNQGTDLFCIGDSVVLESTVSGMYQWYMDSAAIDGATAQTLTVGSAGNYMVEVIDTNTICPSFSAEYTLTTDMVIDPIVESGEAGLFVSNNDGYDVQWFSNEIPIPNATGDTLVDLSSGGPFTVSYTSALGCEALSPEFDVCIAGNSSASSATLTLDTDLEFLASDFVLTSGNAIGWAVSSDSDGPIADMVGLQNAIDNGWTYSSTSEDALLLSCSDFDGENGDYYITPFASQFFDAGCVPDGNFCLEITGTDWAIIGSSLVFTFPDGSEVVILDELAPPDLLPLIPDTIEPSLLALLPSFLPDGLCFNLSDLYQGDPNGDWSISAQNVGTGDVIVSIPTFDIAVYADSCSSLTQDDITTIDALSGTVEPNTTSSLTITIDAESYSAPFPTINASCEVFGEASAFSVDCGTVIEDIFDVASFNLYPNPNNGQFSINMDVKEMNDVTLQIVDVTGRLVMSRNVPSVFGNFTETFDLKNNLNAGFYVFNVKVGDYQSQIKFVVQ